MRIGTCFHVSRFPPFSNSFAISNFNQFNMLCLQVRAGCFSVIPLGSLPAHPLLDFVFNSLQVILLCPCLNNNFSMKR